MHCNITIAASEENINIYAVLDRRPPGCQTAVDRWRSKIFLGYIILPQFQITSHSKNLGESKIFKFYQIYMTR